MADSPSKTGNPELSSKVTALLEELQRMPGDSLVSRHIQDILTGYEEELETSRAALLEWVRLLLAAYARRLPPGSLQATEIRVLQLRLAQPLSGFELPRLREHLLQLVRRVDANAKETRKEEPVKENWGETLTPPPRNRTVPETRTAAGAGTAAVAAEPDQAREAEPGRPSDRRVDVTYRKHLSEKRERIQKIQDTLARHVAEVIKQNEKFGVLLEVEQETLNQTDNIKELDALKQALIAEVMRLKEGHQALAKKLEAASKYMQIIETEGQHLNEELTRVHILSLTDELTELPNRRAFTRRLEDEVARVQRYGSSLSLALIDMDGFKGINDKYGHAAGDEVLRNFSTNVLSIFRHHDMVARYGGEEFAVLLPNTDKNGAARALEKVRKRAAECPYQFEGNTMPMPTFSAGIALYKPGETPGNLIERADKALYQAKRLGRNRIELAEHDGTDASSR